MPVSNVKFINIDIEKNNDTNHINILPLDSTLPQSTTTNTSGLVDIRNLPHSEEDNINNERNVYMLNTEPDPPHPTNPLHSERPGDHLGKSKKLVSDFLSIPQDAVHFSNFLGLDPTERDSRQNDASLEDYDVRLSDSGAVNLLSLLTGESDESVFPNKSTGKTSDEVKKCPILSCTEGTSKCIASLRLCSEKNSFLCKRDWYKILPCDEQKKQ